MTVCPEVPGQEARKYLEIRFFAPANLVSNLDFVESIFGNGGNPFLAENDAGLDVEHWTGHTGCVILAPHLTRLTKKEVGLPHFDEATERQRKDGMCWKDDSELYNDGTSFKITGRDESGVIVTILYFVGVAAVRAGIFNVEDWVTLVVGFFAILGLGSAALAILRRILR